MKFGWKLAWKLKPESRLIVRVATSGWRLVDSQKSWSHATLFFAKYRPVITHLFTPPWIVSLQLHFICCSFSHSSIICLLFIHSHNYSSFYSFIHVFILPFIHSFMYSFIHPSILPTRSNQDWVSIISFSPNLYRPFSLPTQFLDHTT